LRTWCTSENDAGIISKWIKGNKYICHHIVTDLINTLGRTLLQTLLHKLKDGDGPHWFSIIIIADEATDVINSEQLNVSIRWVNNSYEISEDSIGLWRVPDTRAETLYKVISESNQ